jgi:hypothetical protein
MRKRINSPAGKFMPVIQGRPCRSFGGSFVNLQVTGKSQDTNKGMVTDTLFFPPAIISPGTCARLPETGKRQGTGMAPYGAQ